MKKGTLWILSGLLCLLLILVLACTPRATPAPTLTPSPTAKPTLSPTSSPISTPTSSPVSFAGKAITVIVASGAGGGTDIMGRVYGKYLSKFLPGNPTVIIRNMPGANGTIGANYVYHTKPDGLTILSTMGGILISQLLALKAVRYDLLKMSGLVGMGAGSLFIIKTGIIDKPEDLLKAKGIKFGHSGGSPGYLFIVAKELLNIPTEQVVLAYSSGGDALRSFLAKEHNMGGGATSAYFQSIAPLVEKKEVTLAFQSGLLDQNRDIVKDPFAPPSLTTKELYEKIYGKPPSGMAWDAYKAMVAVAGNYDKVLHLPPGTPDNIIKLYWDAADRMVKDPEFRKMADPLIGDTMYKTGESFQKEFKANYGMAPEILKWLKETLGTKYNITVD